MKRLGGLGFIALLTQVPTGALADSGGTQPPALDPALQAFTAKDYATVITRARPVLDGFEAQYKGEKRTVYCAMNPHDRAVLKSDGARDAVIAGEDWCMAMFMTAFSQTEVGDRTGAIATLERLTQLSPLRAQFVIELGYAYRVAGKLDQAIGSYERGFKLAEYEETKVEVSRLRAAALRGKGYVLIDKGDWNGAERAYLDSQAYDPDSEVARSELEYIRKNRPPTI